MCLCASDMRLMLPGGIPDPAPAAKASFVCQDASHHVPVRPCELSAPECLRLISRQDPLTFGELMPARHGPQGAGKEPAAAPSLNPYSAAGVTTSGV